MRFDTFRPRGKHWEYLGEREAVDSKKAATTTAYVHNLKVVGVRPAGSNVPLLVHRFVYVPLLSYA